MKRESGNSWMNFRVTGRYEEQREERIMRIVRTVLITVTICSFVLFGVSELVQLLRTDRTMPEITSSTDILEIPCEYTAEQLVEGLQAEDEKDGDLTSQIIPGAFSRFIEKGVCNVTYVVFDSSDNPASLTRKVRFTDYHSPRFTLTEPLVFDEGEGSYSLAMERLGASDLLDGDLDEWVTQTDTNVNYQQPGTYTMDVEVSNSFGDTATAALPVHVVSGEGQSVSIALTAAIVYVKVGETLDPALYLSSVTDAAGSQMDLSQVTVASGVDTQTPGCYEVSYEMRDSEGNIAGQTWLTVIVEE